MHAFAIMLAFIWLLAHSRARALPVLPDLVARDDQPWSVTSFRSFDALPGTMGDSEISFELYDPVTNLTTQCGRDAGPGSGLSVVDPGKWWPCQNEISSYMYAGSWLAVESLNGVVPNEVQKFGNVSMAFLNCYNTSVGLPALEGETCESPTVSFSLPVFNVTALGSNGDESASEDTQTADGGNSTSGGTPGSGSASSGSMSTSSSSSSPSGSTSTPGGSSVSAGASTSAANPPSAATQTSAVISAPTGAPPFGGTSMNGGGNVTVQYVYTCGGH